MKNAIIIFILLFTSTALFAQGKGKEKQKEKDKGNPTQVDQAKSKEKEHGKEVEKDKGVGKGKEMAKDHGNSDKDMDEHDRRVWDGVGDKSCMIPSKNQPAKVSSSFSRDYPNANNVRWTKCRGDWTATFNNGIFRSTAVYHANGARKDTRTPISVEQAPKSIFDKIIKQDPTIKVEDVVKIEQPKRPNVIGSDEFFRIRASRTSTPTKSEFIFVNSKGETIKYDY